MSNFDYLSFFIISSLLFYLLVFFKIFLLIIHKIYLFIQVIVSCSTVAKETQSRYGMLARAIHFM